MVINLHQGTKRILDIANSTHTHTKREGNKLCSSIYGNPQKVSIPSIFDSLFLGKSCMELG